MTGNRINLPPFFVIRTESPDATDEKRIEKQAEAIDALKALSDKTEFSARRIEFGNNDG